MADITNLFYVDEKDVEEVGNSTSDTIYAIALSDSIDGTVTICTSVDVCSDYAVAYQEAVNSGDAAAIEQALYDLRLSASSGFEQDNEVFDAEDTVEEWNDEIDEAIEDEEDIIDEDYIDEDVDEDEELEPLVEEESDEEE